MANFRLRIGHSNTPLPDWLPASGQIANVSLNTISSAFDTTNSDIRLRGSSSVLEPWCSTVFAEDLGPLGSILVHGGGHQDYAGNETYRYDIYTRLCSRISDPDPIPIPGSSDQETIANAGVTGEYWTDETRTAVVVGKPTAQHTYGNAVWVPGNVVGNTNGWFLIFGNFSIQIHRIDLDTPENGWARVGPLFNTVRVGDIPSYGSTLFDSLRSRLYCYPHNNGAQKYSYVLDLPSQTFTSPDETDWMDAYYTVAKYGKTDDLYFVSHLTREVSGRWPLEIQDPVTGLRYKPLCTGDVPASASTVEWMDDTRQLVVWSATGKTLYFGQAPANPRTGTWEWSSRTFTGDEPSIPLVGNPMFSRLHYMPKLGALMHIGNTNSPITCWKL